MPRTITLLNAQQSPTGYPRIISYLIKEFNDLRISSSQFTQNNLTLTQGEHMIFPIDRIAGNTLDIELIWSGSTGDCGVYVLGDGSANDNLDGTYTGIGVNHNDVPNAKTFYLQPNGQSATQEIVPGWNGMDDIKVRIIVLIIVL